MRCELGVVVDSLLTDPATGHIAPELVAVSEALKTMKRANSGLTWIRQAHVREFFEFVLDLDAPVLAERLAGRTSTPSRAEHMVNNRLVGRTMRTA